MMLLSSTGRFEREENWGGGAQLRLEHIPDPVSLILACARLDYNAIDESQRPAKRLLRIQISRAPSFFGPLSRSVCPLEWKGFNPTPQS